MVTRTERVLILCKTYPSPSGKYTETSCVAGLTESGALMRLYPVPFRLIADEQKFRKWQWLTATVEKTRDDHRPESHRLFIDTLELGGEPLEAGDRGWPRRMELLARAPQFTDFDAVEQSRQTQGSSLVLLRPARIVQLETRKARKADWTAEELAKLTQSQRQSNLFDEAEATRDVKLLEKLPFDFYYHYECEVDGVTKRYQHKIVDWEAGALFRRLRTQYGPEGWELPFRQKYETDFSGRPLILMLGTVHRFPDQWLIVSVFALPKLRSEEVDQGKLF
jgi:hypothetical protein